MPKLRKIAMRYYIALNSIEWTKESEAQRILTSVVTSFGGLCCKWWDNDARLKPFDCYIYFKNESYAVELKILKAGKIKFQPHQYSILQYCAINNNENHLIGVISPGNGLHHPNFYTAKELLALHDAGDVKIVV